MEYSPDGKLVARYRVGLELPAAPLVGMSIGRAADAAEPELYLATRGGGVLAFSENSSRQILPEANPLRQLTAVLPLPTGRILLGTEKSGVLVYDGTHLTPFHPQLSKLHITALAGDDSSIWAGTLDGGVIHWHAGQADRFTEAEGLPDPRVLSLATDGDRTFVGTPMGVAEFRDGKFTRVADLRLLFRRPAGGWPDARRGHARRGHLGGPTRTKFKGRPTPARPGNLRPYHASAVGRGQPLRPDG